MNKAQNGGFMVVNLDKLSELLKAHKEASGITWVELAASLSVPETTLRDWVKRKNGPGPRYIAAVRNKFPEAFPEGGQELLRQIQEGLPKEGLAKDVDRHEFLVKREMASHFVLSLAEIFRWFLFEANASERNELRDWLGKRWEYFQNLCRAMTGETAFEVIKRETGLTDERGGK